MTESYFSADYATARRRFLHAAGRIGASISSYAVNDSQASADDEPLFVDVAMVGSGEKLVVVSSGLHGVEGFFGSAVQLALINQLQQEPAGCRYLFMHALNPFGFKYCRRADSGNIDLNRNFPTCTYTGAPAGYQRLDAFLNPKQATAGIDLFKVNALLKIARHGLSSLKESVASGQYEYPHGLFYGGSSPADTTTLVTRNMRHWVADAQQVFHVDLHTGLGKRAQCRLLANANETRLNWLYQVFGEELVESLGKNSATAYPVNGQFGSWLQVEFGSVDYRFIGAEFGTYPILDVLQALRAEQRQHLYGDPNSNSYIAAKKRLVECFCPADEQWRKQTVKTAIGIISRGTEFL